MLFRIVRLKFMQIINDNLRQKEKICFLRSFSRLYERLSNLLLSYHFYHFIFHFFIFYFSFLHHFSHHFHIIIILNSLIREKNGLFISQMPEKTFVNSIRSFVYCSDREIK